MFAGSLYLKYGKYMAAASASVLAANSLKLEEEPVKEPMKEIEEALDKNR